MTLLIISRMNLAAVLYITVSHLLHFNEICILLVVTYYFSKSATTSISWVTHAPFKTIFTSTLIPRVIVKIAQQTVRTENQ